MLASGQAYHFSQGWLPGGKRSPPAGDDVSVDSTLSRLLQAEYNRRTAEAAAAVKESLGGSPAGDVRPFKVISSPRQHYTRFLRLVCSSHEARLFVA